MIRLVKHAKNLHKYVRNYSVGDKIHGYAVDKVEQVSDFNLECVVLTHEKTGARHCHIVRDDSVNTFSVGFATTPFDSTGVSHILEHTALCGSEQYPVRDPFFKMLTRSLSTFMNAMTAPDFTMYPFSTQNKKDFYNLLSVYCDAVFYPKLSSLDFQQEGWRLEQSNLDDVNSPIIFKGVVFNEMKGYNNYSSYVFGQGVLNNIFPTHTYSHCSGGEPIKIPDLSHEQLVNFHRTHYHPSNAIFYTYGDIPLEDHLQKIGVLLDKFECIETDTAVPSEANWDTPRRVEITGPPNPHVDPKEDVTVSVSYKLPPINDGYHSMVFSIITDMLVSGAQSKFYEELIASQLGSDFVPGTGFHPSTKDTYFTIGLSGVKEENVETVLEVIDKVWRDVVEEGVDEQQLDAVLHQAEFGRKHQTTSFGLHLSFSIIGSWIHGMQPPEALEFTSHINRFKEMNADDAYIKSLVNEYFHENNHKLTLIMKPDLDFGKTLSQKENEVLQQKVKDLTDDDKIKIQERGVLLRQEQDKEQDLSCLPRLAVSDIPAELVHYPVEHTNIQGVPVQIYTGPTNGITYFRCTVSDMDLVEKQISVLPMYGDIISNIGAAGKSYKQSDLEKMLRTGKFNVSAFVAPNMEVMDKYRYGTLLHSSCLNSNIPYMYSLWQNTFSDPNFHETDRIKTLVDSEISALTDKITQSGHQYALRRARGHVGPIGEINEQLSGFRQARTLADYHSGNVEDLVSELAGEHILHCDRSLMSVAINTTPDMMEENLEALEQFLGDIPDRVSGKEYGILRREIVAVDSVKEYMEVPNLGINFCARAYRTVPLLHPDSPHLTVLQTLLSTKFLHKEIREKGGAYGSGAMVAQQTFSLFSYRDPNTTRTLKTFDNAASWIIDGNYSDEDLEECKITAIGKRHAPQAPSSRGLEEFMDGMNLEQKTWFKDQMLSTSREDLRSVATKYLIDNIHSNVVVGDNAMVNTFKDLGYSVEQYGHKS